MKLSLPGQRFPARFSALPEILRLIANTERAGLDAATLLRAQTAVEELFANSIHHGYGGESDKPVWLSVTTDGNRLVISYSDASRSFDPFATLDDAAHVIDDDGEATRLGGVGRHLVRGLADQSHYRRTGPAEDGRNEITLEFSPRPKPSTDPE